jgi:hypothetical protein
VSELDEAWALALAEAEQRARGAGRADVAAYLRLKSSNDLLRKTGIEWLLQTFHVLAGKANRAGSSIQISEQDAHRFSVGNATMVGPRLTLIVGVRTLSVEAGWPRVPGDSFIRGGGLARARIKHMGRGSLNQELLLVRTTQGPPSWEVIDRHGMQSKLIEVHLQNHITKLISDAYH